MRTAFIEQLIDEARINKKIFLLVGDLGYSVIEPFAKEFPDRFINVGIAEQNMIGIASGLAMTGYIVYVYSIANFPTLRCMEQIRYDVCYHNLNVKIVSVGGGYAYGSLGASHHATEELGMLRTIPNLVVCAPGDPIETKSIIVFASHYKGPCYIRIGKAGEAMVHLAESKFNLVAGSIIEVKNGNGIAVFSTGSMLNYVSEFIKNNNIAASIYSFPFIKPINKEDLLKIVNKHFFIITIEEHQAQGGFGSAILEAINDLTESKLLKKSPVLKRIAIPDKFYSVSGSQQYLRELSGLTLNKELFKY